MGGGAETGGKSGKNGGRRVAAVMLDDILNDFTAAMNAAGVSYDPEKHSIIERRYHDLLYTAQGAMSPLGRHLFTELPARPEGVAFFRWLRARGYVIILCTDRDIRLTYCETTAWLKAQGVPYDFLFTASAPALFGRDMGVDLLVYGLPGERGGRYQAVRYTEPAGNPLPEPRVLGGFGSLAEVEACIQKRSA